MTARRMSRAAFATAAAAAGVGLTIGTGARAHGLTSIDITISHYPALDYALPVVIAQQLGYMRRERITVNPSSAPKAAGRRYVTSRKAA